MIRSLFAVALLVASVSAAARDDRVGDVTITNAYALPTPPGATTGAAYVQKIGNAGKTADALVSASSPAADRVEIHTMKMEGDVMRMRSVPSIPLAPSATIAMTPGLGYHLMLIGLHAPLAVGAEIPMTLRFERAGAIDVTLTVQERSSDPMFHHMAH